MAIRIKSTWHRSERNLSREKSFDDHAGALAFITWRLALEQAKTLHAEGYRFDSDHQRVGVINEFLAFGIQVIARLVAGRIDAGELSGFVNALAREVANHVQDNLRDIAGPGNYVPPFLALMSDRMADYGPTRFADGEPAFEFLLVFGTHVREIMGEDLTNRWVLDQIMEITGPEVCDKLRKSVDELFSGR